MQKIALHLDCYTRLNDHTNLETILIVFLDAFLFKSHMNNCLHSFILLSWTPRRLAINLYHRITVIWEREINSDTSRSRFEHRRRIPFNSTNPRHSTNPICDVSFYAFACISYNDYLLLFYAAVCVWTFDIFVCLVILTHGTDALWCAVLQRANRDIQSQLLRQWQSIRNETKQTKYNMTTTFHINIADKHTHVRAYGRRNIKYYNKIRQIVKMFEKS